MPSYAAIERENLVDALRAAGPRADTLCAGWTTHDLAAHLVARERRPDSGPGILVPVLASWTERVRRGYARLPYPQLLDLIAGGPPWTSPFALPGVDGLVNLTEHFVHCEDVRRAVPGWQPRDLADGLQDALWSLVSSRGRLLFRRAGAAVTLRTPDGRQAQVSSGPETVTIEGEPAELLLFGFGRGDHARVKFEGGDDGMQRVRTGRYGI
ncbi:MAG TPA: TIGR03085 family metal-binding protein [Kineosporiaceae bacterium]|nr:TIGR03085 family metal-binding protein [Kineosporiaceae bacterium]